MTYSEAEKYLYTLNNLDRYSYLQGKTDLQSKARTQKLLSLLGYPEKKIPHYIHVTGTSGKGSVCLMLESVLRAAGKKTGTLISPHPTRITERWLLNSKEMPQKDFVQIISKIKTALDKYLQTCELDPPSFLEVCTAIGLLYFAQQKVDWAIIEVGMGGEHDSTNVIPRKDIAIITSVGLDHLDLIGPTKKDVALEKCGIITKGCTVFTQEKDKEIIDVLKEKCKTEKVQLKIIKNEAKINSASIHGTTFFINNTLYALPVIGTHQICNANLVFKIADELGIKTEAIKKGLGSVKLPLRVERISDNHIIIVDGAHNPEKIKTTKNALSDIIERGAKLHLLVGFSKNKDCKKMIKILSELKLASIACTRTNANAFRKAADPRYIKKCFQANIKSKIETFINPESALAWSLANQKKPDILLITGSIFLSGEVKTLLNITAPRLT